MKNKEKIEQYGREIKKIDISLYILLSLMLGESVLAVMEIVKVDIFMVVATIGLMVLIRKNIKNRNMKETLMKMHEAMDNPDAFDNKYND